MLIDDVNGTRLNVIEEGEGCPLLLLHGLGGSWREWQPQLDGLADQFRCIAIEHRGHGRSERTMGRYTVELLADDVAAVCAALGIEGACVAGLALGGMVAQSLALRYPRLVQALALVNSVAGFDESLREGLESMARFVRERGFADTTSPGGTTAATAWSPTTVQERPELIKDNLREGLSTDPDSYARAALAAAGFDLAGRLDEIHMPTLVLWGEHDVLVPLAYSERLSEGIADAELVVIRDAGHLCTLEQPAMVNCHLRGFFNRCLQQGEPTVDRQHLTCDVASGVR